MRGRGNRQVKRAGRTRSAAAGARAALVLLLAALSPVAAAATDAAPARARDARRESPFVVRAFRPFLDGRWIGDAVCYGPYRDGQRPGGPGPSREELREDLRLMARHWSLLRTYGATGPTATLLDLIREERLPIRVVLGAWIAPEERRGPDGRSREPLPEARAANRRELDAAVRLAAEHPDIVLAVSVGNETQVSWSAHRVPPALLIGYLRETRARTRVPVATADDFAFWTSAASRAIAREVDLILVHAHPLWNGRTLDEGLAWTRAQFEAVRASHPHRAVTLGETGWATARLESGEQGRLMRGRAGEAEQAAFCAGLRAWARAESVTVFLFEAFDEKWKGGADPGDVEKHWGLFRADRTPKAALTHGD
uniref:Endo-1,3-beta-glucanase btgC n=1 Tax=Eiseniibacteriota bacterium TaxID=2212470 RepID=A0A832MM69_UNCEI